ncbi:hypothetical protein IFT43_20655 [Oxalobacteraceae sp. CFBP 13708]|nr:hypothetical protein [Oxalobacteraceae sp. CFBP 13708]
MNSSDFRLVRLTPTTTSGSFSGGGGSFYDSTGTLQTAAPNTLRLTYDPADLSKAPWALIEPAAPQLLRYTEELNNGGAWGGSLVTITANAATAPDGTVAADRVAATTDTAFHYLDQEAFGRSYINGEKYTFSVFARADTISRIRLDMYYSIGGTGGFVAAFNLAAGTIDGGDAYIESRGAKIQALPGGWFRCSIVGTVAYAGAYPSKLLCRAVLLDATGNGSYSGIGAPGVFMWGWNLTPGDKLSSYIASGATPLTRAADVVGAGAGLVYSNVPITEPLWVAGTYAKGAKVRDAANLVYESLADGNTAVLTEKLKWLPLGATNRWKVFDKAVNSQTTAPGLLVFSVKPGVVAGTLMLLNMEGASVTVSQSESGYVKTQSLVRHEVDNWYDFYYEEPIRAGDAVFTDIPPYPSATLTVAIDNGPGEAKIGACLVGKPLVIGKVTASFSAGVLSYSTSNADTFGNIEMVKRYNAPRMNFDVMIPAGREDEAYRVLRQFTDTEIGVIVGDAYAMGIGYGFLGQWDVPKSGNGRTARIEFKGLV